MGTNFESGSFSSLFFKVFQLHEINVILAARSVISLFMDFVCILSNELNEPSAAADETGTV